MDIHINGWIVVLRGDFDVRSTGEVRQVIYDAIATDGPQIVLDMDGVETIDLTALRLLAVATRQAQREGRHLTLRNCRRPVLRMLHLSRLAHAVEVERARAA